MEEWSDGKKRKDKKTILQEERLKEGKKERKEREGGKTSGSKEDRRGRLIERDNSKDWVGEDRYTRENYSRGFVRQ